MSKDRSRVGGNGDIHIPHAVVTTLGRVATLGLLGSFVLVLVAELSDNAVDAVTATLITAFLGLGANAGVALGAILATTNPRSATLPTFTDSSGQASTPVTVVNAPADPVPTTATPDAPAGMPDPMGADPGVLEPDPAP